MIHFNVPPFVGTEFKYMQEAVENHKICGDGPFTKKCNEWLENRFKANRVMLTTSGSTAWIWLRYCVESNQGMK